MPSGAEWEDLIVFAYNQLNNQKTDPTTEEAAMKFWPVYEDQAFEIAKNFNSGLSAKALVHTGRGGAVGTVTLGPLWNFSRADKTPKTDIASNDFKERISLKKAGGSQLASAAKAESIAIVKAALSEMGNEKKFAQDLVTDMESKMERLISNQTVTALKQAAAKGQSNPEISDFQSKDKQNKELSTLLSSYMNQNTTANALFSKPNRSSNILFLLGLVIGPIGYFYFNKTPVNFEITSSSFLIVLAGFLVGLGTRMGGGCTSGHGICGISKFSIRSIIATITFIITGITTVFILQQFGIYL